MPETTPAEILTSVKALREDFEGIRKNALTVEEKTAFTKVIDDNEALGQKFKLQEEESKNREAEIESLKEEIAERKSSGEEMGTRLESLELLVAQRGERKKDGTPEYRDEAEYKALTTWCQKGVETPLEMKAELRTDDATTGGYLVPTLLDNELVKQITEIDPVRAIARVRPISVKTMEMAIRTTVARALFEGEGEIDIEGISAYTNVTVTPFRQSITVPITMDQLMNAAFNMESEIMEDTAEGMAEGEGINFINGDGVKKPEGIAQNAVIVADRRPVALADIADGFMLMTGDLKVGYNNNAQYLLHRLTLAHLRTLRDTNGQFLWSPGMNGPTGNTLNGFSYVLSPSIDPFTTATGDIALFGDFRRCYTIVDRTGLGVIRDDVTRKRNAIVEFTLHRWLTGIVTLPEAMKLLRLT